MKSAINIILLATVLLASCKGKETPKQGPKSYPVVSVESRTIIGYVSFPTSIQGINNNDIRAKIQGYIQQVYVDEGQYVKAGQPLFKLETNMISQNADAAKSGVDAANSAVKAAQSSVDAAQLEVDKLVPLVERNIISNIQLETAKANLLRAKSQLDQAKAGYYQAMANYKGAQANVDYSVIRAPISGVVGKINLREGSLVGPTDQVAITTVSETKELYAYFSMNESEYLNFLSETPGSSLSEKLKNVPLIELQLANGAIYPEKGKLEAVTGQINPQTGSIQFRVSFSNKDGLLTNGNSGNIRIPKQYNDALVIPQSGTYEQQGLTYAFKIENDTAKSVVIEVLDRIDNLLLIQSGLKKGDVVAANGTGNLKNNTLIKPVPTTIDSILKTLKPIF